MQMLQSIGGVAVLGSTQKLKRWLKQAPVRIQDQGLQGKIPLDSFSAGLATGLTFGRALRLGWYRRPAVRRLHPQHTAFPIRINSVSQSLHRSALASTAVSVGLLAVAIALKPTNYPLFTPALPETELERALLRISQVLWWSGGAGLVVSVVAGAVAVALLRRGSSRAVAVLSTLFASIVLAAWLWLWWCDRTDCM